MLEKLRRVAFRWRRQERMHGRSTLDGMGLRDSATPIQAFLAVLIILTRLITIVIGSPTAGNANCGEALAV